MFLLFFRTDLSSLPEQLQKEYIFDNPLCKKSPLDPDLAAFFWTERFDSLLTSLTLIFLLILGLYSWHRRNVPGALPFAISCLLSSVWVAAVLMESLAAEPASKILWIKIQQVFQLPSTISITCFLLEYAWPGRWLNRRNLILLAIAPALYVVFGLTNNFHFLLWQNTLSENLSRPLFGPVVSIFIFYSYLLVIVNFVVYGWLLLYSPDNRWPAAIMLTGTLIARGIYLVNQYGSIHTSIPLNVLAIGIIYLAFAIALFIFGIFDPTKLAHQQVITQMREGMIVLDLQDKVVRMNPSAQQLIHISEKQALRRPIQELLPGAAGLTSDFLEDSHQTEICFGNKPEVRHYSVSVSTLKDWRGMPAGRLWLLYDITDLKQAQAQLIDQGCMLAALEERQNLARDLHDSTSQVLGYVGFQLDAVRQLYQIGKAEQAENQLARLSGAVQNAHAEIREFILNLRMGPAPQQSLIPILKQHLESFSLENNIEALLIIPPGLDEPCLDWQSKVQVFRIVQEALSNARKHAQAKRIMVTLEQREDQLQVLTQDDGCGFNPQLDIQTNQYGILFMRERAEKLGGSLLIQSERGAGTNIVLKVPLQARLS